MAKRRHTPEQVINKLREAELAIAEGSTVAEAARRIGVTEQTFYRWRSEYGGLRIDQSGAFPASLCHNLMRGRAPARAMRRAIPTRPEWPV